MTAGAGRPGEARLRSDPRFGMTLIEILVATMLITVVMTVATTTFVQMRALAKRVEVRQNLHNSARVFYERMNFELSCLMHGSAFFVTNAAADGGSVELVFLRGKLDPVDFTFFDSYGWTTNAITDQVWTRWHWDGSRLQITLAASAQSTGFRADKPWRWADGYSYQNRLFRNLPTPQRVVLGASPATTLDANAYGTGSTEDIGDYQHLLDRAVPITVHCRDFRIEVVSQDGTTYAPAPGTDAQLAVNGVMVDGRAGPELAKRPRLLRIRFTLFAPGTAIAETFSFSFQTPAMLPAL